MKALEPIWIPDLRAFEKGLLKPGCSSSHLIHVGKNVEEEMKKVGYTDDEVAEYHIRILKGNPHWVSLESEKEEQELLQVKDDAEKEKKRKEELSLLKKDQQLDLLKKLGVTGKQVPHFEVDRVNLIYELESKV